MSLSKHLSARRLVPALFPLAHADATSAAASRRARRRGAFVATPPTPPPSPSSVRLAEPLPSLAPSRLALHNRILALLSPAAAPDDLAEATLLTRHALHSNCRPSSFTCVAVLAALLRARRLDDFFALHRFALQAAFPPTAATHALYLSALAARRLPDNALLHLRLIARPGSPVPPSPTAYRVVVKCLVANHDAIQLKDEMLASGFVGPDPHVYSLLMPPVGRSSTACDPGRATMVKDSAYYGTLEAKLVHLDKNPMNSDAARKFQNRQNCRLL